MHVAPVRFHGRPNVPVIPAEKIGHTSRDTIGAADAVIARLEGEMCASQQQIRDCERHLVPHTIPHLTDRIRQTSQPLATSASRDFVGDSGPAAPVRVNEVVGQLGVRGHALGSAHRLVDEGEVTAWERGVARWLTRTALPQPLGHNVHDFGGHDTVGRQLAAGDADDAVGTV
jgi:hypothetical protein